MDQQAYPWIGQAVSVTCDEKLGVFQGTIKDCSNTQLTITRAFRNGVPLRKQDAEVTLTVTDIQKIEMLPTYNLQSTVQQTVINKPTPVKQPNFGAVKKDKNESQLTSKMNNMRISNGHQQKRTSPIDKFPRVPSYTMPPSSFTPIIKTDGQNNLKITNLSNNANAGNGQLNNKPSPSNVAKFFGNLIPSKVEVKMGASLISGSLSNGYNEHNLRYNNNISNYSSSSKPIDISNNKLNNNTPNKNHKNVNKQRRDTRQNVNIQTFGTPIDDPTMGQDFDFEGNLALFDKQAIWDTLESRQKPDVVRQAVSQIRKYRHDENIISAEPTQLRQIESYSQDTLEFVTDEGLIIPTISLTSRNNIQQSAEANGLALERQCDILARGCTDLAIILLGGARRLTPNNRHQYPKITIITDKAQELSNASIIAAATGRFCASHGLKVYIFVKEEIEVTNNVEFDLFKATGNDVIHSINDLPSSDLVIISISTNILPLNVKQWISENRSAVLAIDPPPTGIADVAIKCSILPILPLNNTSNINCGKLYLCNLGIPDKYFGDTDCVKTYKSPFGSKFVIPIHKKND